MTPAKVTQIWYRCVAQLYFPFYVELILSCIILTHIKHRAF